MVAVPRTQLLELTVDVAATYPPISASKRIVDLLDITFLVEINSNLTHRLFATSFSLWFFLSCSIEDDLSHLGIETTVRNTVFYWNLLCYEYVGTNYHSSDAHSFVTLLIDRTNVYIGRLSQNW